MALTSTITAGIAATQTNILDLVTGSGKISRSTAITLASGTGANQADLIWSDTRTVAASGTDALDLAGSLTTLYGTTLTIVKLKFVLVFAASGNTNNVRVNRPASNGVPLFLAAGDGIDVLPGGFFAWCAPGAGVTVTAATGDIINVDNSSSGTSVTYDIYVGGTSA
jgi:hypothetical protein